MPISSIARTYKQHFKTLEVQYKLHLSDYTGWLERHINKENMIDYLIYPENFGPNLSVDEIMLSDEFYTVITNKDGKGKEGCLCAIVRGTKNELVSKALSHVPIKIRYAVKEITLDLANSMDWIVRTNFPNAIHTADRFHFQKVVTEGLQEMRVEFRREAINKENKAILETVDFNKKHQKEIKAGTKEKQVYNPKVYSNGDTEKQLLARSRYLLYKPKSQWSDGQKERSEILFQEFPKLKKAYNLTMYFRSIFEKTKTREEGKKKLDQWYEKTENSKIKHLISAANTIKAHEGKILNYFHSRASNASAENFNAKLKGFRTLLRGINDFNFFLFRIEKLYA